MADFTKTISNTVGFVGGKRAQPWGSSVTNATMVWGTNYWGSRLHFENFLITHLISESLVVSGATFVKSVDHSISESITITDDKTVSTARTISESLSLTGDSSSQSMQDQNGYYYVFPRPTTNNETTVQTAYSSSSAGSTTFTSATNTTTNWS